MAKRKLDDPATRTRVLDLIRAGHGRYEAAQVVGITSETFRKYFRDNPDFQDEVEDAIDESVEPILKMYREEGLAGDITAAREYMKFMAPTPRSERHKSQATVKHTHELVDPSTINSIEELQSRIEGRTLPAIETHEVTDD